MNLNFLDNLSHEILLNDNVNFHEYMNTLDARIKITLNLPNSKYRFV
jgi:hypothetical protein